ncbi:hypothetical protein V1525DRAFT_12052 [Lipomyces kononenkoae]|uniref:Uncharacterized protein n=1 Tax=Lipomyces kononenkoae TaxID=34357 RepID=A0ACC3T6U2_LIPKO
MEQFATGTIRTSHAHYWQLFATDLQPRNYVQQYAIRNNSAVIEGRVKNKDNTIFLICKCNGKTRNTRNLPAVVGTQVSCRVDSFQ